MGPPMGVDTALSPDTLKDAPDGALVEIRPGDQQVVDLLAERVQAHPGRALLIEYGPAQSEIGDTLQAIKAHEKVAVLDAPGTADLTARVDFQSLLARAAKAELTGYGPEEQGDFLMGLGLEARAAVLSQNAPDKRAQIARQVWRLTDPDQMGQLFKLVCLDSAGLPPPPGFSAS